MEEAFPARPRVPADFLVMIVDDDADIRYLVEHNLKKEGFQTVTAVDGLDAYEKLTPRAPDLIFLDLMMPGQSGYEFLRHLQGAGHPRLPIVIATARALDPTTVADILREANVVEFFTKPFNWPLILNAISRRLNIQRPAKP
jgi:CheY-like chemotaxis protein